MAFCWQVDNDPLLNASLVAFTFFQGIRTSIETSLCRQKNNQFAYTDSNQGLPYINILLLIFDIFKYLCVICIEILTFTSLLAFSILMK